MAHDNHESQDHQGDVNARLVLYLLALGAVLVLEIVLAVQGYAVARMEQERQKNADLAVYQQLNQLTDQQRTRLSEYRWVDPAKGVAAVPIERAMQLYISEQEREGASSSGAGSPRAADGL